ncbi:MAG: Gfo/Idh/MocA family oxidoreductase [Actinobacteria bacterium]|nr:Gfo/Idh/MocA family oxidoreductase [Actinomycetota bacterium]
MSESSSTHRADGPVGVGLIGAGMISDTYLENLTGFPDVRVLVVGDLDADRAREQAGKHGVAGWGTAEDVLAHPDVELVVNLTVPAVHAQVSSAALSAGKHVWSEKPIAVDRATASALVEQARAARLLVGVAPDTVLGPGLQTARRLIARGDIGRPLSAQTVIQYPGPQLFHPNPAFLFAAGAGPLYDVGPYYLTALAHLFGSYQRVAAVGISGRDTRTIEVGDLAGTEFPVSVPTHVAAISQFSDGGMAQSLFSFDSPLVRAGSIEITGTEGTMLVPDPNVFTGDIKITRAPSMATLTDEPQWVTIPAEGVVAGRGIGALDMARRIRNGGDVVASADLGLHILDVMIAMDESMQAGQMIDITSSVAPVPPVSETWNPFETTIG